MANSRAITPVFQGIWLVIELGQDIMPTNNFTKFDDGPLRNIQITEQTRFILTIFDNSRAITARCFMGSGWLSNLARDILPTNIFTKFDDYTMTTIEVIELTNALLAARLTFSHNT